MHATGTGAALTATTSRSRTDPTTVARTALPCVASVMAFVPPLQWVLWLGIGGWASTLVAGSAQPLAVAWLGVVGQRAFHQLRDRAGAPAGDDRDTHGGGDAS